MDEDVKKVAPKEETPAELKLNKTTAPATKKAVARIMEESVNRIAITQGILSYSLTRLKPEDTHSAIESPSA